LAVTAGQQIERDVAFVALGAGEREGARCAIGREDRVQSKAPEESAVASAVMRSEYRVSSIPGGVVGSWRASPGLPVDDLGVPAALRDRGGVPGVPVRVALAEGFVYPCCGSRDGGGETRRHLWICTACGARPRSPSSGSDPPVIWR
jgi:hypothetical protein